MSEPAVRIENGRLVIAMITPAVRRLARAMRAIREEAARKRGAA